MKNHIILTILLATLAPALDLRTATISADPRFELCAPVPLSLICFRRRGGDEANRELLDKVNASGEVFLSHTVLPGRFVLRLAIGNHSTTRAHVQRAWELIQAAS